MTGTIIILFIAFVIWALIDTAILLRDVKAELEKLRRVVQHARRVE